jgi:uncharacterized lipoprotein YajG
MNRTSLTTALATLLLAACAAPPQQTAAVAVPAAKGDEQICTREYPTGSALAVTKCRSAADIAKEREAAAEAGRNIKSTGSPPPAGGDRR